MNGAVKAYARWAKKAGAYQRKMDVLIPLKTEVSTRWSMFVLKRSKLNGGQMREMENLIKAAALADVAMGHTRPDISEV